MDELTQVLDQLESLLGPVTVEPELLEGGITNHNYRVGFGDRICVLRITGKDTSLLGIDRTAERMANQAAAELGFAPRVLAADERWLVTEYVDAVAGEPATVREVAEPVGRVLRAFHDSGVELPTRFWVPELLGAYAEVVRAKGAQVPREYARACDLAGRIADLMPRFDPVPCHDDLLPGNVMRTTDADGVMLVDWEYAGMGHRLFDLGNVAVNNDFGAGEEELLLTGYFGRPPSDADRAGLRLMRIMSDAREAGWGVVQGVISELEFDFDAYAAKHFERLAAAAEDPRLEEWFSAAAA